MTETFFYQPGPAGSGKTHQLAHWTTERIAAGEKVLIAQPTRILLRATMAAIKLLAPEAKITLIVSNNQNQRVVARAVAHMEQATPHDGEVLFVTHETLKRLPTNMRRFWHMVSDEIPAVLDHQEMKIARTHRHITDHIDASKEIMPGVLALQVGDRSALEAVQVNPTQDQNIATFSPVVNALLSGDHLVLVDAIAYADLTTNPATKGHVDFFSILLDSFVRGYASVTFMGANVEETELFVLWSRLLEIEWQLHPQMGGRLRYSTHQNGSRLTIGYLFDGRPSKRFLCIEDDAGVTTLDRVTSYAARYMGGTRFLWQGNRDQNPDAFDPRDRLPGVAHGLDRTDWKAVHNVVLVAAMNRRNAAYALLDKLGVSPERAQISLAFQNDYQAMMRCSLRDPQAIAPVRVIVGSKAGAEWIAAKFPGCQIEKLEHGIAEPRSTGRPASTAPAKTAAERMREHRAKKKAGL